MIFLKPEINRGMKFTNIDKIQSSFTYSVYSVVPF